MAEDRVELTSKNWVKIIKLINSITSARLISVVLEKIQPLTRTFQATLDLKSHANEVAKDIESLVPGGNISTDNFQDAMTIGRIVEFINSI